MTDLRWTGEQAEAILETGDALLAANAGTGKTTTVIQKIIWRLGYPPGARRDTGADLLAHPDPCGFDGIAAITFTEKAAYDLRGKLRAAVRKRDRQRLWEIDQASIGTIHGFCGDLLREHALRFGIDPGFRVLDEKEARVELDELIRDVVFRALRAGDEGAAELVQNHKLYGWEHTKGATDYVRDLVRDLRWHGDRYVDLVEDGELDVERLKALYRAEDAEEPWSEKDDVCARRTVSLHRLALEVEREWRRFQSEENVRDFDSLILDARELLLSPAGEAALASLRRRLRILIIDEFQDTDGAQRDIAFAIAGLDPATGERVEDGPQLFLVGDPKQSIYRFRGADISVWNQVRRALHGDAEPLALTENFRSVRSVVGFVNRAVRPAMETTAETLDPDSRVVYADLHADRDDHDASGVEWLVAEDKGAHDRRSREAELVAKRIRDMVVDPDRDDHEGVEIIDPDTEERRPCEYRDCAILFRARRDIDLYEEELQRYGVPYYLAGDAGFTERQEILDCLTVLRLVDNPRDDLRAFAFLRSPFVGLRDEVLARMRIEYRGRPLRKQARLLLDEPDKWHVPEEGAEIVEIERRALKIGLDTLDEMIELRSRLPIDRLMEEFLERTGYRSHLLLKDQPQPYLANLQRFVDLLESYRGHTVGTFLDIWDHWQQRDLGIPQAPLYSREDNVVTLSTIHSAKGLEWPVVFLVKTGSPLRANLHNTFWHDPALGPLLCPKKDDRGPRAEFIYEREKSESRAEDTRLIYVATTRARDRLVVAGPPEKNNTYSGWLARGRDESVRLTEQISGVETSEPLPEPDLSWLGDLEEMPERPTLLAPVRRPPRRPGRSASELMARDRSFQEWRLKYWHGVIPRWYFARKSMGEHEIPPWVRGTLIHGVLEQIQDEAELAELLDVAIGALDSPELEEHMAAGTEYRSELEKEIRRVIQSEEWAWYTDGEHYRELDFVQLVSAGKWRVGAFDLYRPRPGAESWIIDFKTHQIDTEEAEEEARNYRCQALLYAAVARSFGAPAAVRLHFTRPNAVVDLA